MALPCKRYTFLPQVIDGNLIYEELPCNRYALLPQVIDENLIYEELPCNRYAPLPQVIGTVMMWLKCNVNVLVLNSSDYVTYDCVRFQVIQCINALNYTPV